MGRSRRPAATLVTLVNRHSTALYSGMVPGVVAGLYREAEAAIDLRRLCRLAQVTFVQAEITGLDLSARELRLEGRPPLRFDRLSLDVGAVTAVTGGAVAVKPLEPFLAWAARRRTVEATLRIRGGGAAAVELALAFAARGIASRLLLRGDDLHLGSPAANRAGERLLAEAGIPVERRVNADRPADLACTGSRAPAWLAAAGLPSEPATGRVLTEPSLAVVGHPHLFACGDCGVVATAPRPPAGVWAVRATPVLAANLARCLDTPAKPLRRWHPPRWALQLLGDGGGRASGPRALASWGPLVMGPHRWLWTLKDRIDRRFMERFQLEMETAPMACRGCAAKLAPQPLARALARVDPSGEPPAAEDAPVVGRLPGGAVELQSVDGFPALVEDPWLNARLTTLHACGDLWASGADVHSVQVVATLPEATPALQEELLVQSLAGVRSVLEPLGARLIGGHTLEGRDGAGLALALTVNGRAPAGRHWGKGPLRPGDALLLTRPLGTGVLFAAAMAGAARPRWIEAGLAAIDRSQAPLVALLARHGCHACTDVTGFGLLGHLGEMLGGEVVVRLDGAAVPALPGTLELLEQGHASTLAPANAAALRLLGGPVRLVDAAGSATAARQALWIDPQTCGPLLAALPAARAPAALAELRRAGFGEAAVIAQVETATA